jgi:glycyl-tRNA synthetase beta subunit
VLDFISGRLRVWLGEQGWATDVVNAVLAAQPNNPTRALLNVQQLTEWVGGEDWSKVLDSFARCVRITRGETETFAVDEALFAQPEENALHLAYKQAAASLKDGSDVDTFLSAFAPMVPVVSKFFGEEPGKGVLVNSEDAALRRNRIGLLQAISAMQNGRVDLSQLSGF